MGDQKEKEKEGEWRGRGRVIGRDRKVVGVKHWGNVREVRRVHITRLRGIEGDRCEEEKEEGEEDAGNNNEETDEE